MLEGAGRRILPSTMRRNPAYRTDYESSQSELERLPDRLGIPVFQEQQQFRSARRWGLHHTPDPGERADAVTPIWALKPPPVSIGLPTRGSQRSVDLDFLLHKRFRPRLFIAAGGERFLDLILNGRLYRLPVQSEARGQPPTVTITVTRHL